MCVTNRMAQRFGSTCASCRLRPSVFLFLFTWDRAIAVTVCCWGRAELSSGAGILEEISSQKGEEGLQHRRLSGPITTDTRTGD